MLDFGPAKVQRKRRQSESKYLPVDNGIFRVRIANRGQGPLAQLVEQGTFNPKVGGSSPPGPTSLPIMPLSLKLGCRPMAGLRFLVPTIGVRIPAAQPLILKSSPGFEPMRSEAVKRNAQWAFRRPTGRARKREVVISRSEMESLPLRQHEPRLYQGRLSLSGKSHGFEPLRWKRVKRK